MNLNEETLLLIKDADRMRMPFGRFGPKKFPPGGVPICDLPYEYMAWFRKKLSQGTFVKLVADFDMESEELWLSFLD